MPPALLCPFPPFLWALVAPGVPGLWIYMGFAVTALLAQQNRHARRFACGCACLLSNHPQQIKRKVLRVRVAYGPHIAARLALCTAGVCYWLCHAPSCRPPRLGILHPRFIHRLTCSHATGTPHTSKNKSPSCCNHWRALRSPCLASFIACTITAAANGFIS